MRDNISTYWVYARQLVTDIPYLHGLKSDQLVLLSRELIDHTGKFCECVRDIQSDYVKHGCKLFNPPDLQHSDNCGCCRTHELIYFWGLVYVYYLMKTYCYN